jgi:hypothetical protein
MDTLTFNCVTMANSIERRKLRFASLDEAIADADQLLATDSAGKLRHTGNWDLGQTFGHIATWTEFAFNGYPPEVKAPLPIRLILRAVRSRILNKGMITGARIGKHPDGTLGTEKIDARAGADRLRSAFTLLKSQCPTLVNPVFGMMTHEQWIQLNLRHAELHLSFQIPQA